MITFFLFESNYFQVHETHWKWDAEINSAICPVEALETCNFSEYVLSLEKRTSKVDKNQKLVYENSKIFCAKNPCRSQ